MELTTNKEIGQRVNLTLPLLEWFAIVQTVTTPTPQRLIGARSTF